MQKTKTRILSIDTSCDETSVAVTENTKVLSNIIWSQASLHAKWGGVLPSLAKREHEERIDWVITKALKTAFPTAAPGLAGSPFASNFAFPFAIVSSCLCSNWFKEFASTLKSASFSSITPSFTKSTAIFTAACAVLFPFLVCNK